MVTFCLAEEAFAFAEETAAIGAAAAL